jgi:ubiquinone/menaquinone biosynthesis C-methylase UbiE
MPGLGIALWVLGALVVLAAALRIRSLWKPTPYPPWATRFLEGRLRRRFAGAERTLHRSGLERGMRALEVGPGGGYLSETAVSMLGDEGRLVCLDLQIEMLNKVRERLGAGRVALVQASGSSLPFAAGSFDLVFLVTVLGEIPDKRAALAELARVLRPGGILAITEGLPDPDYVRARVLRRLAAEAGFEVGDRHGNVAYYTQQLRRPGSALSSDNPRRARKTELLS